MKIKFWGCRGSIPVPDGRMIKYGGNTCCVEIDFGSRILIIDAGTGIRKLGEDLLKRKILDIDIFITHSHWDHIQGFPFFTPIYSKESNISILGATNSYKQIKDILAKQMSYEYFPVRFTDLKSKINFIEAEEGSDYMNGYMLRTIQTNHPIYTLGIRIEKKERSFVFITDNELCSSKTDTSWEEFVDFCKNATYLIHDAQFTQAEYNNRKGWGHSAFEQVINLAKDANVQNLGFFHHDPDRKDDELDIIEQKFKDYCKAENCGFNIFVVREQGEIDLTE